MSSGSRKRRPSFASSASLEVLRRRAEILARARRFFAERGVLEVETPVVGRGVLIEAHIDPIPCIYHPDGARGEDDGIRLWLQTSPEASMKRLLASGSGPIYQITRAFRNGERGRVHNPEFTILEWYRPELDHHALMEEVGELMRELIGIERWEKKTYREVFQDALGIDPFSCPTTEFPKLCLREKVPVPIGLDEANRNGWLDLLLSTLIEPTLGRDVPCFVHDYPPSQAVLAKIGGSGLPVAERFELYVDGIELCNGFHELQDPREHRLRFEDANVRRVGLGKEELPVDAEFLDAVDAGLPECAGVAVGFDRVVMLACGAESIDEVMAFPLEV